jgi:hypothetical protein
MQAGLSIRLGRLVFSLLARMVKQLIPPSGI